MPQSSGTATLSPGRVGPGLLALGITANNLTVLTLDFAHSVIHVEWKGPNGPQDIDLDMVMTTNLTDTIVNYLHTMIVSGS